MSREDSFSSIAKRIAYLNDQIDYFKSVGATENVSLYMAVVSELYFWKERYESNLVANPKEIQ